MPSGAGALRPPLGVTRGYPADACRDTSLLRALGLQLVDLHQLTVLFHDLHVYLPVILLYFQVPTCIFMYIFMCFHVFSCIYMYFLGVGLVDLAS